ncbi:MAG: GAF domain-containing protein [Bryobacteraceae bacterium]
MPPPESERMAALLECKILDTPPEQPYDDLAALAADICDSEIALISLVDNDRQWFKAKVGLKQSQTSREVAFCAHTISNPSELLIVNDARKDPRFANNPLVIDEPFIRFYAGAPLIVSGGHALGAVCVVDRRTRRLLRKQEEMLRRLARVASALIDARRDR